MMIIPKSTLKVLLLSFLSTPSVVSAHSWIEQLMIIAPNGTMIGQPGFPRGNVQRSSPSFSDTAMVFLIPPNDRPANKIDANQMMCRPEQTKQTQSSDSPRLKAAPGQAVALRYQENGHVTLPQNTPGKPNGGGANFVYFTANSKPDDKFLQIHRQWNSEGTGGDARGRLISTQNFDDGQCYQINGQTISKQRQVEFKHEGDPLQGQALWCQQDIQIPTDAQPGTTITLYWVWDWPTSPGTAGAPEGKQEIYTTCMDIDIVASTGQAKALAKGFVQQDLAKAAVSAQFADIANPTAIKAQLIPFSGVSSISSSIAGGQQQSLVTSQIRTSTTTQITASTTSRTRSAVSVSAPAFTSVPASTADNSAPATVTVKETVTVTARPSRTRSARLSTTAVTTIETDFVTVLVTKTIANKAASESNPSLLSTDHFLPISQALDMLTSEVIPVVSPSVESSGCSKAERVYRLRARNPFYILPSQDRPNSSTSAGTGCESRPTSI